MLRPFFEKNDGRYYKINRLNAIFAVSSIALLVAIVWVVMADRDRDWKHYQRAFREIETAVLAAPAAAEPAESAEPVPGDPFESDPFAENPGPASGSEEVAETVEPAAPEPPAVVHSEMARERWSTRLANVVRNLPFLDFAAPIYRIDQIVVHDIAQDLNFTHAPRVDRCVTCHQGILRPEFDGQQHPYAAHPKLDLFLGANSPHPLEDFGCTGCHGGRGRGTDFVSAGHTPSDEAQEMAWREVHNWRPVEHPNHAMYPRQFVQAGCYTCHAGHEELPGAEELMLGLELIERGGCYGCHALDRFSDGSKRGPSLEQVAQKTSRDWTQRWLKDPQHVNPGAWMPRFFVEDELRDAELIQAEVTVITEYLFQQNTTEPNTPMPMRGNAANGRALLTSVGCLGCHLGPDEPARTETNLQAFRRSQGPWLVGLKDKTTADWLYHWLKDPSAYDPTTAMPNLRLADQEAADLVAYLMDADAPADAGGQSSDVSAALRLVAPAYMKTGPSQQALLDDVLSLPIGEQVARVGERLIRYYGCAGCHQISGIDNALPDGPELNGIGSKTVHDFDFGFVDDIPHTTYAWLMHKVRAPRSFQRNTVSTPAQRLRMPQYAFNDSELEAVATALLGMVKENPGNRLKHAPSNRGQHIAEGRRLLREYNCRGCHIIEDEGGAIRPKIAEWVAVSRNAADDTADAIAASFSPPNLIGEGKKVHGTWLFDYLDAPTPIRPWLEARMPTYGFEEGTRNAFIAYFHALDDEAPFAAEAEVVTSGPIYDAGEKLFSADYFDCGNCHIQGDQLPSGSPDRWAPNFALSAKRLKSDWVREWLYNPQPLLPGTKMPTYFDPEYFADSGPDDVLNGDEHQQIEALKNYLFTLGIEASETGDELVRAPGPAIEEEVP